MRPIIATIRPEIAANEDLSDAMERLARLEIHCEAKDFGRPPPLLANLYELACGRPFEANSGAIIRFSDAARPQADEPRLQVVWMRIDTARGDLACGSGRRITLAERLDALKPKLMAALASGSALLVLDWSHEEARPFRSADIARIAARYAIKPHNIAILAEGADPHDAFVDDEADPLVLGANAMVTRLWRLLFGARIRRDEFRAPFGFAASGPRTRVHPYILVNDEASATRANLVARLLEHPKRGLIAFPKDRFRRNMPGSAPFRAELDSVSLFHERGDNHARVETFLAAKGNLVIEPPVGPEAREAFKFLPAEALYHATLMIVAEPQMARPGPRSLSPGTLKALVTGLPYIVFGAPGTIGLLRSSGFDVLDDFVDHSYDAEADPAARFAAAFEALEAHLAGPAAFTIAEQDRLVTAAAHNRRVFEGPFLAQWLAKPLTRLHDRHPLIATPYLSLAGLEGLAADTGGAPRTHH